MGRKTIAKLILGAEVALAAYLALGVWLLAVWMVDDSRAFRMVPSDWHIEGLRRLGAAVLVGALFGGFTYFVNRRWVTPLLSNSPRLGSRFALFLACCIVLSGTAGAIQFVVTKPYM